MLNPIPSKHLRQSVGIISNYSHEPRLIIFNWSFHLVHTKSHTSACFKYPFFNKKSHNIVLSVFMAISFFLGGGGLVGVSSNGFEMGVN